MPKYPKRTAPRDTLPPRGDTTRLKREVARLDRNTRAMSSMLAKSGEPDFTLASKTVRAEQGKLHKAANAKADTLRMLRNATPTGGHKSFAKNTEGFDGRAITSESSPKPPRVSIPRGNPAPDALPSAKGTPALARKSDGTENLGADYKCFEAGSTRPTSSTGRGPSLPEHFNDSAV